MGKQSARIYFRGKDHKEIYYQGHYHDAMYIESTLVWEKIKGETGDSGEDEKIEGKFRFKVLVQSTSEARYFYMAGSALVDWGDGSDIQTIEYLGNAEIKHCYAEKGEYIITIEPKTVTQFGFSQYYSRNDVVTEVLDKFPKEMENTKFDYCFYNCVMLTKIPEGLFSKCTNITTFKMCFYNCYNLIELPKGIFENCSNVKNFDSCFYNCKNLTKIPEGLFDSCSDAIYFNACFEYCSSLVEIPKGLFSKCLKLYDIRYCFHQCIRLGSIPETLFTADNCQYLNFVEGAFYGCISIVSNVPILWAWGIYPAITSYKNCFKGCTNAANYESIPSGWK